MSPSLYFFESEGQFKVLSLIILKELKVKVSLNTVHAIIPQGFAGASGFRGVILSIAVVTYKSLFFIIGSQSVEISSILSVCPFS